MPATIDLGTELASAILGADRLYRGRATGDGLLDREGLVAVPPASPPAADFSSWQHADAAMADLERRLPEVADPLRRDFVAEMLDSMRAAAAVFGGRTLPYAERVERCLRVPAEMAPEGVMESYRQTADTALREMGYSAGVLGERVRRYESDQQVPPDQVEEMLGELLDEARRRAAQRVLPLPSLSMEMTPVGLRGAPFSAYCDYKNRQLKVNLDYVYTRTALKHLACHEAFPGHLLHMAIREERAAAGLMPADAPLVVVNSATSAIFEGIGENGMEFLEWVEGPPDRLGLALNRLRSAARVNAALMIHRDGVPRAEVGAYLLDTCFTTPAWVESRLAFLTHALRAPFIFAYWYGDVAVERVWQRVAVGDRRRFFEYLYHNMHTPATLDRYWPAQSEVASP
jgi:hypothetical protein